MNDIAVRKDLFKVYEKMYFNEQETKEKLANRVQVTLAMIFVGLSASTYMIRMLDYTSDLLLIVCFSLFFFLSITILSFAIYHLVRAFWGNTFAEPPTPEQTENYLIDLEKFNADCIEFYGEEGAKEHLEDVEQEVFYYLYDEYKKCASHNIAINEERSQRIHKAIRYILFSLAPFSISALIYIAADLDVSSPRKETLIENKSLNAQLTNINYGLSLVLKSQDLSNSIAVLENSLSELKNEYDALNEKLKGVELMSDNKPKVAPVKPERPPTRYVKENHEPGKTKENK
ncbi:hypothetical protein [Photobacterium rosenbergii]|uniref:SMODS and SLOG-associating 2TM effector domain-containing protein n=1 Tax=Photobacterium rosenbergii TaxID=294936 RepID=A0ABU3ZFF2_9GAMM|nr:hypothetical protein [Photobacterium rosenbergii]MDV5168821.1 hypothetical protein [Photobacterium rosenbergii]